MSKYGNGNYQSLEHGHISVRLKTETYKGQVRHKFTGRVPLPGGEMLIINIPVLENGALLIYPGKDKNANERYARVHCTRVRKSGMSAGMPGNYQKSSGRYGG